MSAVAADRRTTGRAELLAILKREHGKAHTNAVKHARSCRSRVPDGPHCCPRGRVLDEYADQVGRELTGTEGGWT